MYLTNETLMNLFNQAPAGLSHGNTGIGLYLGLVDRAFARSIIAQGIQELKRLPKDLSLEYGIIGVVPFLNILATRQFRQPLNALLEEVDSIIYKKAGYSKNKLDVSQSTHLSLYLAYRLSMTNQVAFYKNLWVSILSTLTETILISFPTITSETRHFSLNYPPAFYLLCFLMSLKSGLDNSVFLKKFIAILPYVVEYFPHSPSNKLYYYLVLQGIKKELHLNNVKLDKHIKLLFSNISVNDIEEELKNKIYVGDGICGLYLLCHYLGFDYSLLNKFSEFVSVQLETSAEIRRLYDNPNYLSNHIGFWDGIGGILLTSLLIRLNNIRDGFNM